LRYGLAVLVALIGVGFQFLIATNPKLNCTQITTFPGVKAVRTWFVLDKANSVAPLKPERGQISVSEQAQCATPYD
jgi:hypothetical protein